MAFPNALLDTIGSTDPVGGEMVSERDHAISVVVPSRNEERYIARCVLSVLNTADVDLEVIVVLDRCTDRTDQVLASLGDPRVRWLANAGRPGLAGALNTGIAASRAKYVARLDADDVQEANRFTVQLRHILDKHLDVCCGQARLVDSGGNEIGIQRTPQESEEIRKALRRSNVIVHSTVVMDRDRVLAQGGYRDTLWEDYDLWVRLSRADYKFGSVDRVVVTRQLRPGGWGEANGRTLAGRLQVMRHRLGAARAVGLLIPW